MFSLLVICCFCIQNALAKGIAVLEIEADKETEVSKKNELGSNVSQGVFERLRSFEGTALYFDYGRGNDLDGHLDIQYSFRYLFTEPTRLKENQSDYEVSFTFTGEFDFYAGTRDSGPVIGRRYNPGIMFQRVFSEKSGLVAYNLSIEHESNGQSTNTLESFYSLARDFETNYAQDNQDIPTDYYIEMASDTISRSTEAFASIGGAYRVNLNNVGWQNCKSDIKCFEMYFKFRESLLDVEDDIFWDPSMVNAKLLEHQGSTLSLHSAFDDGNQFLSFSYRTGQIFGGKFGKKNTFDLSYFYNLPLGSKFRLPMIASYHHGYMEELNRYSYKASYFSLGLYFSL